MNLATMTDFILLVRNTNYYVCPIRTNQMERFPGSYILRTFRMNLMALFINTQRKESI